MHIYGSTFLNQIIWEYFFLLLIAGYGFLSTEPVETVARRQELIHKQNIARWGL